MDDAEVEWRAHTTQIRRIEADAEKHRQEVLTTTNTIEDAIQKNNMIFGEKWEMTHDRIDRRSEDICLLKNRIMDLEAYHLAERYGHLANPNCTLEDSHHSRLGTAKVEWVLPSKKSGQRDVPCYWEPSPD